MKKEKIFISAFLISAFIWCGLMIARFIVGNDLLIPRKFEIISTLNFETELSYYKILSKLIYWDIICYCLMLLFSFCILIIKKTVTKENPYLTTAIILFFIFVPIEIYLTKIDYDFLWLVWKNSSNLNEYRYLFLERISFMSGVTFLMILCYITIIPILIYRPFNKNDE